MSKFVWQEYWRLRNWPEDQSLWGVAIKTGISTGDIDY